MNKADLKNNWGDYCDTDALVDTMSTLLSKYYHRNTEHGICTLLDTYFRNKRNLIDMFKTSNHYIGDMRIVLDVELERYSNRDEVFQHCRRFLTKLNAENFLVKYTDNHGKTEQDYLKVSKSHFKANDLLDVEFASSLRSHGSNAAAFDNKGRLIESVRAYNKLQSFFDHKLAYNYTSTVNSDVVSSAAELPTPVKLTRGMKTSRAFNKVCTTYGLDKANPSQVTTTENGHKVTRTVYPYDKLFAQYADSVSDCKRKLKFFISLNPLDYLTMSFGVNWSSCQTIDKTNQRNMPNHYSGAYCGGTLSYMLDASSMITYVHSAMPESIEEGKIYRNMFHFQNDILVQGRVYPQGNDGCIDLYSTFRGFVQNEFSEMLGLHCNDWDNNRSKGCINSLGVHYKDYAHFGDCNVSMPTERRNADSEITIGHQGICVKCGERLPSSYNSQLTHSDCH